MAKKGKVQGERQTLKLFIFWGSRRPGLLGSQAQRCQGSEPISGSSKLPQIPSGRAHAPRMQVGISTDSSTKRRHRQGPAPPMIAPLSSCNHLVCRALSCFSTTCMLPDLFMSRPFKHAKAESARTDTTASLVCAERCAK